MEIGRHQRKCSVCSHPELRAIEKDYLGWVTMAECARRYSLRHRQHGHRREGEEAGANRTVAVTATCPTWPALLAWLENDLP